jgi:transposase
LRKRKTRNVAIVATARKLVTIAPLMLKHDEPYRYAQPERVRAKLRHVEPARQGKSAPKPVAKSRPNSEPANRLSRTYSRVGLPPARTPDGWSAGER